VRITGRIGLLLATAFWLALLPLFARWLLQDHAFAPWDMAYHSALVLRLHDGLLHGNPWRVFELSRFYPPLFHVLAVPASFLSTHPDAFCVGNWIALLLLIWAVFLAGSELAGPAAGLAAALLVPSYAYVTFMARMPMTDLSLTATVAWTLFLLCRWRRLDDGNEARWLGISIGLGMLAKWPYAFFTFLPLADLVRRHAREAGGIRDARFWRPLGVVALWAIGLAAPWYVRSVPYIVSQLGWQLGSGVTLAEGDAPPFTWAALEAYADAMRSFYLRPALVPPLLLGLAALGVAWLRRDPSSIAPPGRWSPLFLSVLGGAACLLSIANKDARYPLPFVPSLAVVSGAWVGVLGARAQRVALGLCAVAAYAIVWSNLFRLEPPDATNWRVIETAERIAADMAASNERFKVLVVPNEPQMNFMSLSYAIERTLRAKVQVERVEAPLDAAKLAEFGRAVIVLPPPEETVVSRSSQAAAAFVAGESGWIAEATLTRGDGRRIEIYAPPRGSRSLAGSASEPFVK
jgi:4-amino-4-deoxy-L-arabinose transferase-like glycosyltransferase